jgi:hypothetical protein
MMSFVSPSFKDGHVQASPVAKTCFTQRHTVALNCSNLQYVPFQHHAQLRRRLHVLRLSFVKECPDQGIESVTAL